MAAPRLAKSLSKLKHQSRARLLDMRSDKKRKLHLEPLEDRRLMAQGPSLVAVIPNSGVFLQNNATLNEAPRELTFRFAQGNTIDPATLATGIVIDRPGPNGAFEPVGAVSTDDIPVSLGFLGIGDTSREVIMRFAGNLPDDSYQITLVGIQPAGSSIDPRLKDTAGNPFVVNGVPSNATINLRLDLGAKVEAVVPQPITRTNNILSQGTSNTIEVYFDQQLLAGGDQQKPGFYRLINASTGSITLPQSVSTPVLDANRHSKVTLTFASAIAAGTYKLEVGTTSERDDQVSLAQHVGNSMARPIQAFIGDNLVLSSALQANDVDLYKFEVHNPVTNFGFNVAPALGSSLDVHVRLFAADGVTEVAFVPDNTGNGGVAEAASNITLAPGTYYVGVSAVGNTNYNALLFNTNGNPSNGTSTGAYSIQVTFGDLPTNLDDTVAFNNSSFASASVLGVIGTAGKMVTNAVIGPHPDLSQYYSIQFPGAGDAPGDRNIPFQGHINTVPGRLPDPNSGIETITYDFQSVYGFTPDGNKFFNSISEAQKQRAREAFELYSRYLGVQFREVPDSERADITVATGSPQAVAPNISTGTGTANTGVNGIAGVPSVISTADVANLQTSLSGPISNAVFKLVPGQAVSPGFNRAAIFITSPNHSLKTGDIIEVSGVQGMTSANGAWKVTVLDDNNFSLDGSESNGAFAGGGTWTLLNVSPSVAIMNSLVDWQTSQYGGAYFQGVMNQIGKLLGLGDNYEAPGLTIMGGGQTPSQASNTATAEPVFPGDADIVYGQTVHRPEGNDIDIYQFTVTEPGLFRSETVANRGSSSLLDTVLTLYKQTGTTGGTLIARNDDYYGTDSYLEVHLQAGTYYLAVTSVGNTEFDPNILNSGFGGRTQGAYELTMTIKPDAGTTTMRDSGGVAFDGDADGVPGGTYQFWFQANTAANTIYVDRATTANQIPAQNPNLGTIGSPYRDLDDALAAAGASATKKIVRIVGNGGTDGNVNTLADNKAYIVGFKDPQRNQPLADGGEFNVPRGVTVMIDAGAIVKMRRSNLNAGTTDQGIVSRAGAAIQVLGTPTSQVTFTSYADDTAGGDSDGNSSGALGGDYGGIVFRDDSDHERDFTFTPGSANNPLGLTMPVFLNYVNYATMRYGGGKVSVDSIESTYDPIHLATARPTISYNTIQSSANAAISANPNAFDDDGLVRPVTFSPTNQRLTEFDERRIGPEIHDNTLGSNTDIARENAINGLFVRIRTSAGSPIDFVDVPTRWDDTDITHIVAENLLISATPGGSESRGAGRTVSNGFDSRLRIDPGMVVKLNDSRIEAQISSQFIAEGTAAQPIIFTSLRDDKYGGSGSFDTNRDNSNSLPAPGDWGGLIFDAASSGSIAFAKIMFGGGETPIEGGFDSFNAVEIHQADVRIVNSLLQLNDSGGSDTDRNGRGTNADATIFVRGAQPIIVNNIIRDNAGPLASINANAMTSAVVGDYGQTTGLLNAVPNISDNRGPLIRGNRMTNNRLNGMVVRGGTLTTETIWDDTDIAHIVFNEIIVPNHQVFSGLRLQSTNSASLVVKLSGANAGFTASGRPLDINDRIGGTVQILGQPGFPVVLTSISDDSISAGFDPSGLPMFDTDNTGGTLLTGPEVNNATLIDNDVLTNNVGHFEIRPGPGGSVGFTVPNTQSGVTTQGKSLLFTNAAFIFEFFNYIDVGSDGNAIDLSATTITQVPILAAPDLVVSEGTFLGENGPVKWHVETRFDNGSAVAFNTVTFSSVDAQGQPSTTPLGNLRFINYLDEDIQNPGDDLLVQTGTPAVIPPPPIPPATPTPPTPPGADFRLLTLDDAQRVGFSQGGVYVDGPGLSNATYDGFAADRFSDLRAAITGATGAAYTLAGNIDLVDLPPRVDPALGNVNGLADVTTAMAWTVSPTSSSATVTTFLELIPQNPTSQGSPGDWRGVKLDQFSNDRNVGEVIETERGYVGSIGQNDNSRTPQSAQFIGALAPNQKSGDEARRLGFQIDGAIAYDFPADVDVYSFNANSGTEVWVDIDRTSYGLDAMIELVDSDGNVLARATDTNPNVINVHDPNVPTDAGLSDLALSFNKDPFNGRDTYSTNAGPTLLTSSGAIVAVDENLNPINNDRRAPIVISSPSHGLVTGDQVVIEGVGGTESANGTFIVTRLDADRFSLNGVIASASYTGGGTWTRLVTTTRDPIMRVVLPNGVNGPLTNAPFFIRVRSQPATFAGEAGNNLNPGLTSGQYQLQVRLQQKDEKPGSTIRFTDMRFATNAIEIQGLPNHSPLAGETVEGDNTTNDTFAGAQDLGNLLRVDRGTISVGGQITSTTDVDWYQFDLNFDLMQFVNTYTDGFKTWSTIFDIDYADGSVGGDFTVSVFDQTGTLIFIGRDSDVADDQSQNTATLGGGSFGKHDAFIGPTQLPAVVPGQIRRYFVAVSSDRSIPAVLDQTFSATPTDANIRLEPIESISRVVSDPLESFAISGIETGNQTAEFPSNLYVNPNNNNQPVSTFIDTTNVQSLKANVKPFSLADVSLFVSGFESLYNLDPTVGQTKAVAPALDFEATGPTTGTQITDFNSGNQVIGTFTSLRSGFAGSVIINVEFQDLGGNPATQPSGIDPTISVDNTVTPPIITIVLNNNETNRVNDVTGTVTGTTAAQLLNVFQVSAAAAPARALVDFSLSGDTVPSQPIGSFGTFGFPGPASYSPLQLIGSNNGGPAPLVQFSARNVGPGGNQIGVTINRINNGGIGPTVQVVGSQITVNLDTTIPQGTPQVQSGTTIQQMINAIVANPAANSLIEVNLISGDPATDIANAGSTTTIDLDFTGGTFRPGSIEVDYVPRLTTSNQNTMADLSFRADGLLYGYEGVGIPGTTNTAGRLTQVNVAAGGSTTVGNDGIPDAPATPVNPPTIQSRQAIDSDLSIFDPGPPPSFKTGVAGMAWGGTTINGIQNTLLYYAIPDDGPVRASRLYRADPNNGSAALVQNQPWGRVGDTITSATPATGQTDFGLPGSPVSMSFQTTVVGPSANGGVIRFSAQDLQPGVLPQVTVTTGAPLDVSVVLNTNTQTAFKTTTFASESNANDFTFIAGAKRPGGLGNNVTVVFTLQTVFTDLEPRGPKVSVDGSTINVILDGNNGLYPESPIFGGTTADQLDALLDGLQNDPNTADIILSDFTGPGGHRIDAPAFAVGRVQLGNGISATTAAQLATALNNAVFNGAPVLVSSLSGDPSTQVALSPILPFNVTLDGALGAPGYTTGLAFGPDEQTLYGITDEGQFLVNINRFSGLPERAVAVQIPDPSNPGVLLRGSSLRFQALTPGPQNLEDGRYANMFFAMTDNGILCALDSDGIPQIVFDTNNDGIADSVDIQTGLPVGESVTGLAFSPFDFNLWHPTFRRQDDPGHDVNTFTPTRATRDGSGVGNFPTTGRGQDVNQSLHFGFENWVQVPGFSTNTYQTFLGSQNLLGTGNVDVPANSGQLGMLSARTQRELSTNPVFNNTYDLPGGAYGSLITDKFSLATLSATDKPTFYFDYFLDTEDINDAIQGQPDMRDSARVYVGPFTRTDTQGNSYTTWDLLATNNSFADQSGSGIIDGEIPTFQSASVTAFPENRRQQVQLLHDNTGVWRQSRVDLSRYAGLANLQLRFDFSTAGQMPTSKGNIPTTADPGVFPPRVVTPGQEYLFEDSFGDFTEADRGQNNEHEGFFIDNIMIGAAERGEMVTNAPVNTDFAPTPTPQNLNGSFPVPTQTLTGPYQLEIRRGAEYGLSENGPLGGVNGSNGQTPILLLNTNDRLISDMRLGPAIPLENFESQNFNNPVLRWSFTDDAPWTITTTTDLPAGLANPNGGLMASSGALTNGQGSGLSLDIITGNGNLTFGRSISSATGDELRLFIDGRLAKFTAVDGVPLAFPADARWSGNSGNLIYQVITVPITAGHHNIRWTYEKNAIDPPPPDPTDPNAPPALLDKAFIDDIQFPTPQVGFQDIYEDVTLHNANNPGLISPPIGPTVPPPAAFAQILELDALFPGFTRGGDENQERQQGHIQIEMNQIFASQQVGIFIDAAQRDANGNPVNVVRNLPVLNGQRLLPGVTIANNVVSGSGVAGIHYSGDVNPAGQALAAVPFGRIINNTIYGAETPTGTGILVTQNAGPTLLNNIVANTSVGISVDALSTATTVIGSTLYANNSANTGAGTSVGSNALFQVASDPLFIDASTRNFYLQTGAKAINSAQDALPDRETLVTVKSALGIPRSDILAPDFDLFGQFRLGEGSSGSGGGQNITKDRGAIERADFLRPTATVNDPLDNDTNNRDRDDDVDEVAIRNENLTQFVLKLNDVTGVGIDDSTVTASQFTLTLEDGTLLLEEAAALAAGVDSDYQFVYNQATDEAIFLPTSGIWPLNHTYKIKVNNNPIGAVDPLNNPLPVGILDRAGNSLEVNRAGGETFFTIFVGTLFDFGDAPAPYPVLLVDGGAAHAAVDGFFLGAAVTEESEGQPSADATADDGDPANLENGVTITNVAPGIVNTITVIASIPPGTTGRLDAWLDFTGPNGTRDGDWTDSGEKLSFIGNPLGELVNGSNTLSFTFGDLDTPKGPTFARFRLTSAGINSPSGPPAADGEVEDYRVNISGPPFQNPDLAGISVAGQFFGNIDVTDSGNIAPTDALTVINFLNAFGSASLVFEAGVPVTFDGATSTIKGDPAFDGPGQSVYIDVDGDTQLTANDALQVINFLNSPFYDLLNQGSGEGEGEAAGLAGSLAESTPVIKAAATEIPMVLLASPDVVLEVRERPAVTILADNQVAPTGHNAQDLALLALGSAPSRANTRSLAASTKTKLPLGPLDSQLGDDSDDWDELLTSLATDLEGTAQGNND